MSSAVRTQALPAGTILLVDDDEALLSSMSRLLRPDGLRVLTASNGEGAIAVLEAEGDSVGVVVSDYAMPGMNGADLLRAVRLRWPDSARILATGNADLAAAARVVNEGQVARLITKPCDPDQFRHIVTAALADSQVLLENRRLRQLAEEQSIRLEQWNQRLEQLVNERTAALEQANASLQRGLRDTVRLLIGSWSDACQSMRIAAARWLAWRVGSVSGQASLQKSFVRCKLPPWSMISG